MSLVPVIEVALIATTTLIAWGVAAWVRRSAEALRLVQIRAGCGRAGWRWERGGAPVHPTSVLNIGSPSSSCSMMICSRMLRVMSSPLFLSTTVKGIPSRTSLRWVIYLALPFSLHPSFVVLPFATLFALSVAVTVSTFKKYL